MFKNSLRDKEADGLEDFSSMNQLAGQRALLNGFYRLEAVCLRLLLLRIHGGTKSTVFEVPSLCYGKQTTCSAGSELPLGGLTARCPWPHDP